MQAGLLRERIDVLRKAVATDKFGASVPTWSIVLSGIHARELKTQGGLTVNGGELVYQSVHTFQIRYNEGVTEYDRVRWQDRLYRILDITRLKSQGEMRLKCELITQD